MEDLKGSRTEFLASVQQLTLIILDRLRDSSSGEEMDEKETRMLGSIAMRSLHIWEKALVRWDHDSILKKQLEQAKRQVQKTGQIEE